MHAITKFAKHAGYYWSSLLRPVRNVNDANEQAAAKAEMDEYLSKINNGTMTFDQVKAELNSKYSSLTGYPNAMYAGEDFTSATSIVKITNETEYQEVLAEIDKLYEKRDANADTKSDEYNAYMSYVGDIFKATTYYALQTMEPGQIWNESLTSFVGAYIIRLDQIETTNDFIPYEEVSGSIVEALMAEKLSADFREYFESMDSKYEISYVFDLIAVS